MRVIETIGTLQIVEVASGQYTARCPFCDVGGRSVIGETAMNIFCSMMRQTNGWHTDTSGRPCRNQERPIDPVPADAIPEFVAHMKCEHWVGAVDLDGSGTMPSAGESIICPACDRYSEIIHVHRLDAKCHIGGCEKMEIRLARSVGCVPKSKGDDS